MFGWIGVGSGISTVWVKPRDWEDIYVVQVSPEGTHYECWRRSTTGIAELIGTGATPRLAAELVK